jgi:Cu+-exporting ATPase
MQQVFEITGMHCGGCVNRVIKALKPLADEVTVTLDPPRATFEVPAPVSTEQVSAALARIGDYEARALSG